MIKETTRMTLPRSFHLAFGNSAGRRRCRYNRVGLRSKRQHDADRFVLQHPMLKMYNINPLLIANRMTKMMYSVFTSSVIIQGIFGKKLNTLSEKRLCGTSCSNNRTSFSVSLSPIFPSARTK